MNEAQGIFGRISSIAQGIGATTGLAAKYFGQDNGEEKAVIADRISYGQLNGSGPNNMWDALKAPSSLMGFLLGNDNVGGNTPVPGGPGVAGQFSLGGSGLVPLLLVGLVLWLILRR
jgi:hypothetical protein